MQEVVTSTQRRGGLLAALFPTLTAIDNRPRLRPTTVRLASPPRPIPDCPVAEVSGDQRPVHLSPTAFGRRTPWSRLPNISGASYCGLGVDIMPRSAEGRADRAGRNDHRAQGSRHLRVGLPDSTGNLFVDSRSAYCRLSTVLNRLPGIGFLHHPEGGRPGSSATLQSRSGSGTGGERHIPTRLVAQTLGRRLPVGAANVTVTCSIPGIKQKQLYGDRITQLDFRIAKSCVRETRPTSGSILQRDQKL